LTEDTRPKRIWNQTCGVDIVSDGQRMKDLFNMLVGNLIAMRCEKRFINKRRDMEDVVVNRVNKIENCFRASDNASGTTVAFHVVFEFVNIERDSIGWAAIAREEEDGK
jgi:hypothetical protein